MDIREIELNQPFLVKQKGKDVTWSSVLEISIVGFSKNNLAVCYTQFPATHTIKNWKTVDDFNEKFEFLDWV